MKRVGYELMLDLSQGHHLRRAETVGVEIRGVPSPLKFKLVRIGDQNRSMGVPIPV